MSLVPSTTETVFAIDAGDRLVGITRFCVRPEGALERVPTVGGTKSPNLERVLELGADLVLANREENRAEDVSALRQRVPVFVAYPRDVRSAAADIRAVATLLGKSAEGGALASEIESRRRELEKEARARAPFRFLYFIWRHPYMVAGSDTFIDALLAEAGGVNAAPSSRGRYPEMSVSDIIASNSDVILLASEPFPFTQQHLTELEREIADANANADRLPRLTLVDGQFLSWHGSRLLQGLPYAGRLAATISAAEAL